ncbi:hypothetical protein FBZ89_12147 [Nitrospirillum amazonense]|uniref:Uncharacterized protein n=1 Tax=Nitrospirillum amazonense TaxID=28077 RepID=A0A560EUM1_9PROT|nr:hypothetical protein [Nitrospirillum amazonense]TWB13080.1 hypothetical protein FBZ89_12147 [Nitrospirillum amazonense]
MDPQATIDAERGTIDLENGLSLHKGLSHATTKAAGLPTVGEQDMKTGWVYLWIGPYDVDGNQAHFSLSFAQSALDRISFSFGRKGVPMEELIRIHDEYLLGKFGPPTDREKWITRYVFPWGTLASCYDLKGGSSSIIMTWT